jgi:sialic acid synthase SpsE
MTKMIQLAHLEIGEHRRPFIIAEMSGNHNQSLDRALALVDAAANSGADAIKLQTFTADTMTLDSNRAEFTIQNKSSLWQGQSLHKLYQEAQTPWEWHAPIMDRAKAKGLACFSSPFDLTAVDFLESLNVPALSLIHI